MIALVIVACQQKLPSPDVIADVEGKSPPLRRVQNLFGRECCRSRIPVLDSKVLSALLDQLLDERLLWRLAWDTLPEGKAIAGREATERLVATSITEPIGEPSVAQHYRLHRERFKLPERVYIRQVLLDDAVAAADLRQIWAWGASLRGGCSKCGVDPRRVRRSRGLFRAKRFAGIIRGSAVYPRTRPGKRCSDNRLRLSRHSGPPNDCHRPSSSSPKSETRYNSSSRKNVYRTASIDWSRWPGSATMFAFFVRNVPFNYEGIYEQHLYEASD